MQIFLRSTLNHEISSMIDRHLMELSSYLDKEALSKIQIPEDLLHSFERLAVICENSAEGPSPFLVQEARDCLKIVDAFLKNMNQDIDVAFEQTIIGQIRIQAVAWLGSHFHPTIEVVWELIKPVQPDHLEELENGVFEARWWKPVPIMDVKMLSYTPGIQIQGQPFEPTHLSGGLAVRFLVVDNIEQSE
jgi:hypothetical protein